MYTFICISYISYDASSDQLPWIIILYETLLRIMI